MGGCIPQAITPILTSAAEAFRNTYKHCLDFGGCFWVNAIPVRGWYS